MKLKDKVLFYLARNELARNARFKDLHKGQSCYIFGNGISLKMVSFDKFSDRISIGSNSLFVHKDFGKLDCRYYQIPAPFFFYPYRNFYGRFQKNYIGDMYREIISLHDDVHFFTSLSNRFGIGGDSISYTHHFGCNGWDVNRCSMDGVFTFMAGAMHAMLGTAIYMGFESAVLVGCDYTFSPRQGLHFFENGTGIIEKEENNDVYGDLFEACRQRIDLVTIVQTGMKSHLLKYITYEEFVGAPARYKENTDIVDGKWLDYLDKQGGYRIY